MKDSQPHPGIIMLSSIHRYFYHLYLQAQMTVASFIIPIILGSIQISIKSKDILSNILVPRMKQTIEGPSRLTYWVNL
jgi:hypothetical protein